MSNAFLIIDEIEELLNGINDGITTKLNTINTNISTLLTNTASTATENSSGTLSAKLTYLINRRNKYMTAGSTNLKTLSSSGSVSTGNVYVNSGSSSNWGGANGTTFVCYVKYPGIYRVYATASGSADTTEQTGYPYSFTGTARITLNASTVNSSASAVISSTTYNKKNTTFSIPTATKTVDVNVVVGDKISVYIRAEGQGCLNHICGNSYRTANVTATWTDISVRGIATEITSAIV